MKPAANYPEEPGRGHPLAYTLEASLRSGLVHVEHRNVLEGTRFHTQPGIEIHLTLEGRALFHVAGRNYLQTTRQGLIFWGRHPHQIVADRTYPFQRINIGFVPEDFAVRIRGGAAFLLDWVPKSEAFPFALSEGDFARFDELSRRLRSEVNLRLQGWQDAVLGCVLGLLTLVRRNGTGGGPGGGGGDVRRGGRRGELVNQACSHVRNNLAERLALGDVASRFRITPEHLTRSFQRQLGVSFHRYVLAERIAQAKERLRNQPGATVTDIAFECGFVSSDHFGKVFKRHTLMTPSEFRETQA
ncbi:helix-turn-helix transcriptional regulator [Geminisphaera colitermitum]|uniref:helix-turn-helix transcriptional regulator n=1 Tax=Geminisphaera colitermitum TaxID=1148786 RepID=UPI0001965102|nr:AraC family transcriptional regulator [Geminisphaera colitermitum]